MNDPTMWDDDEYLVSHLAEELVKGRLALFLGSGVSHFFGLPDWDTLVNRISDQVGLPHFDKAKGEDAIHRVQRIKNESFRHKEKEFMGAVHQALYQGISVDLEKISENKTLMAIGALVMTTRRGSASKVVTLNFDDLLEIYLEYYGFITRSVHEDIHWEGNNDVTIYHPHGFLPLGRSSKERSETIALTTEDFHALMDVSNTKGKNWRSLLLTLMRTHTFLYIGLSGLDMHVDSLLNGIKDNHPIKNSRIAFHGVRFSLKKDTNHDLVSTQRGFGVYTHQFDDWSELPKFLLKICQIARSKRISKDNH